MKKVLTLLVALTLLFVAGCATTESSKVKCPSCGYEFDVETSG
jgi:transposase-like protein